MSEPSVITRKQGRAGRIILNRPKALHALNKDMCTLITDALLAWKDDDGVELVIVDHAEGTRGFCAGGDVVMLAESGRGDSTDGADFFATEYRLNTLIKEYPKAYVALIDGVTMGGGVGISVHGTHRVASERTLFAMPESGIGLLPDVGGGYFLPRLDGELGAWLALTGDRLKGEDVLAVGVATHYAASDALPKLIEDLCASGVRALDGLQTHAEGSFAPHRAEIDSAFRGASVEEIVARLEAGSEWAQKTAQSLAGKSPLTMKLTLRQLRAGAELDFRAVMAMEYRICSRIISSENFQEGVRAVLIDRDNNPQWAPARLADVSEELLDHYLASLGDDELTFLEHGA